MIQKSELRRLEILQDGKWVKAVSIGQLEKGDVFRMFEPDGTQVLNEFGNHSFIALEEAEVESGSLP